MSLQLTLQKSSTLQLKFYLLYFFFPQEIISLEIFSFNKTVATHTFAELQQSETLKFSLKPSSCKKSKKYKLEQISHF
ncbi:hypothetical protein KK467_29265, partial [Klebsiella pneumoniae]|uniref:hypothetical protein n=1 Tax=Klebsiella pneumoniae TaxID=573 RepID=UPI001BE10CDF